MYVTGCSAQEDLSVKIEYSLALKGPEALNASDVLHVALQYTELSKRAPGHPNTESQTEIKKPIFLPTV